MCLVISDRRHSYSEESLYPKFVPLTAQKPLTVYKVLEFYNGILQTPVRGKRINFISGQAVLKALMMSYYQHGWCVNIGIHAFEKKTSAQRYLKYFGITYNVAIYEAIIPVGTKYFYGIHNTIVSEKLIIKNKIVK